MKKSKTKNQKSKLQFKSQDWRKMKLGEVLELKYGFGLPEKSRKTGGVPVYGSSGVVGAHNEAAVNSSGIVIGRKGNVGSVYYSSLPFYPIDTVYFIDSLKMKGDLKFFYYLLQRIPFQKIGSDVGVPGLNRDIAYGLDVIIPDDPNEQKRIANILSAFDDKIELNNKISRTLEQIAQTIFKEWFVKFRFPGHEKVKMVDSELGKIPEGWEVKKLGDIADVQWGDTSITKASYVERGYPAFSASGQDGFREKYDFDRVGVVLSAIGANCGITWLARNKWSAIKNTIRFWSIDNKISTEYLFLATRGRKTWPQRGSAQPFISLGDSRKRKILVPTRNVLEKFNDLVVVAYSKIDIMRLENQKLAALRDLLLPKLMSGEIRV